MARGVVDRTTVRLIILVILVVAPVALSFAVPGTTPSAPMPMIAAWLVWAMSVGVLGQWMRELSRAVGAQRTAWDATTALARGAAARADQLQRRVVRLEPLGQDLDEVKSRINGERHNLSMVATAVTELREMVGQERANLGHVAEAVNGLRQAEAAHRDVAVHAAEKIAEFTDLVEAEHNHLTVLSASVSDIGDRLQKERNNLGLVAGGLDTLRRSTAGVERLNDRYAALADGLVMVALKADAGSTDGNTPKRDEGAPAPVEGGAALAFDESGLLAQDDPIADPHITAERPARGPVRDQDVTPAVQARIAAVEGGRRDIDLIIMANEINFAHGTGVLMSRVLEEAPPYVLFRAFDHWGSSQVVQPVADHVLHQYSQDRQAISTFIASRLGGYNVRNIVSIAYTREDVTMALTAKVMTGAPLAVWIMDDNSVLNDGIPTGLMAELVKAADARFVISDVMRSVYEERFARPFWILPPLVARKFLRERPSEPAPAGQARGCIVGNIWHQAWLEATVQAMRGTDIEVDWFTSSNDLHFLDLEGDMLAGSGITICPELSHRAIADRIEQSHFVLVPSSSGTETDGHAAAIGRLSLPSKMPFVTASAGTPFLVLANEASGAADYVERFGLGEVVRYDRASLTGALARLATDEEQRRIRTRSFDLGHLLDVTGVYGFLISAAQNRRLPHDRLERAFGSVPPEGRSSTGDRLQPLNG